MKKLIAALILLCASCALAFSQGEYEVMYVTASDGLRVRSEPSLGAKKIDTLAFGEYVLVAKKGEVVTIDGITAPWVKIVVGDESEESYRDKNGWVFGGYLSKNEQNLGNAEEFIKSYLKRSKKYFFHSPYFPSERGTVYLRNEGDWEKAGNKKDARYTCSLGNLCQGDNSGSLPKRGEAVTIRDCMYYMPPLAASLVGVIGIIPAGTEIQIVHHGEYGIKDGTLFPIYSFEYKDKKTGYVFGGDVRGIDIISKSDASSVSDGKGGKYTLYSQRALKGISYSDYGFSKSKIDEVLDGYMTYEMAGLKNGWKIVESLLYDEQGRCYKIDLDTSGWLSLQHPLNMKNPVLFIQEYLFSGGQGGGAIAHVLYTVEVSGGKANLRKAFSYEYLSTDGGPDGIAYHYFTRDGAVVYIYQEECGQVTENIQLVYMQQNNPYSFTRKGERRGEPQGKSQSFTLKQYANTICHLKMRRRPSLSAEKFGTLDAGTLVKIIEIGDKATIDGITSNWVLINPVHTGVFEIDDGVAAAVWVFGGYLE